MVNWLRTGQNTKKKQPTEDFFLLCLLMFLRCFHQNLHQMDQLKQKWSEVHLTIMKTTVDWSSCNTIRSLRLSMAPPAVLLWIKD